MSPRQLNRDCRAFRPVTSLTSRANAADCLVSHVGRSQVVESVSLHHWEFVGVWSLRLLGLLAAGAHCRLDTPDTA
jgi:hypothetical protein